MFANTLTEKDVASDRDMKWKLNENLKKHKKLKVLKTLAREHSIMKK